MIEKREKLRRKGGSGDIKNLGGKV